MEAAQQFGGRWSLFKLDVVAAYLGAFNLALSKTEFRRVYIDAFAGSGDFTFASADIAPLFDERAAQSVHAGSARRALSCDPPFHELHFVERKPANARALRALADEFSRSGLVNVHEGDANSEVIRLCETTDWRRVRGVIFLDPYGNQVEWETLAAISRTMLDVWYLFPLSGVYRNAPHSRVALTPDKRATLSRILGTAEWEDRFYRQEVAQLSLLSGHEGEGWRIEDVDGIEAYVTERLRSTFAHVEPPVRLFGPTGAPLFSLFFAISNRSERAQELALRIARHLLKRAASGTRPKSGR
jgi:three-Cys-motif partner protein